MRSHLVRKAFVLFDLGGTLVDLRGIAVSMAEQMSTIRLREPIPTALLWATATASRLPAAQGTRFRSEREIAEDVLFEILQDRGRVEARNEASRVVRAAWDGFVRTCTFQPDVTAEWLRRLRSKVAGLAIVSDGDTEAVAAILSRLSLDGLFDSVTVSEAVRAYKPDPRIYRSALEALGAKASQSLFVSDATLDLHGAVKLGMGAAWIHRDLLEETLKPPPEATVLQTLQDVDRVVKGYATSGRFRLR